jgi:hypothetical protein
LLNLQGLQDGSGFRRDQKVSLDLKPSTTPIVDVASEDVPSEIARPPTEDRELHSYTKLAIAYTGIGLGLYILFFSAGAMNILSSFGLSSAYTLWVPVAVGMVALMIATIYFLKKGRRLGAYLFLAGVTLYHATFIPYPDFLLMTLIPTGVVTALLLVSFKHLR